MKIHTECVVAVALLNMIAQFASGIEITVTTAAEIRQAVLDGGPGTTVLVAPGTYSHWSIPDARGTKEQPIVIRALDPTDKPVIADGHNVGIWMPDACWLTIQDVKISSATYDNAITVASSDPPDPWQVPLQRSHHVVFDGVEVIKTQPSGNHDGIHAVYVDYLTVRNCRFAYWGLGGQAIDILNARHAVVEGNIFGDGQRQQGIGFSAKRESSDVLVRRNLFDNCSTKSVQAVQTGEGDSAPEGGWNTDGMIVTGNVFIGNGATIAYRVARKVRFEQNTVVNPRWFLRMSSRLGTGNTFSKNLLLFSTDPAAVNPLETTGAGKYAFNIYQVPPEELATFSVAGNAWYQSGGGMQIDISTALGAWGLAEADGVYGVDPQLDEAYKVTSDDPRFKGIGADAYRFGSHKWKSTGGGSYNNVFLWSENSVPSAMDAEASFLENITDVSTVTVESPVTVGTMNFESANRYIIDGPATVTLEASTGNAQINVAVGNHTLSAPLSVPAGLTVDTSDGTSLTIAPAVFTPVNGSLTKDGPGTLVVASGLIPTADVRVNQGLLDMGRNLLAQGPDDATATLGKSTTLMASGHVNYRLVDTGIDAGGFGAISTLEATGQMTVGYADSTDGYDYGGILDVGAHSVTLMDADGAKVGSAMLSGGSLGSSKGIHLDPAIGYGGYITGEGTLYGNIVAGVKDGERGSGIAGADADNPIQITGTLSGSWWTLDNVVFVGKGGRLSGGFSPEINPLGPIPAPPLEFGIAGADDGSVWQEPSRAWKTQKGQYTQYFVTENISGGTGTQIGNVTLFIDNDDNVDLFDWKDLNSGDELVLIQPSAWQTQVAGFPPKWVDVNPGTIVYTEGIDVFRANLLDHLSGYELADDLSWEVMADEQWLIVTVVPEPGTLVLLATGGLGLLARVGRRCCRR